MKKFYGKVVEEGMINFYDSLSEKGKRRYTAVEALKLDHGKKRIEHRLFPHVTRAMQGVMLKDHEMVKALIETTQTKTGLQVSASIINKLYETGKETTKGFKDSMKIKFDEMLGGWNYRVCPLPT